MGRRRFDGCKFGVAHSGAGGTAGAVDMRVTATGRKWWQQEVVLDGRSGNSRALWR